MPLAAAPARLAAVGCCSLLSTTALLARAAGLLSSTPCYNGRVAGWLLAGCAGGSPLPSAVRIVALLAQPASSSGRCPCMLDALFVYQLTARTGPASSRASARRSCTPRGT